MKGNLHTLKILPEFYDAIKLKIKTFEVRFNDRSYGEGDILRLKEWNGEFYTGRMLTVLVTYVLEDERFCKKGFVIMSVTVLDEEVKPYR